MHAKPWSSCAHPPPLQYLMYVTFEVMEPLWAAFEAKVKTASSLDEVGGPRDGRTAVGGEVS